MHRRKAKGKNLPHFYLKVKLEFENEALHTRIDVALFKHIINVAVKHLYGEVGVGNNVDVLKYTSERREAILRVANQFHVQLWSSLTMLGNYGGNRCAFRVLQVSPHLLALSVNSHDLELSTPKTKVESAVT